MENKNEEGILRPQVSAIRGMQSQELVCLDKCQIYPHWREELEVSNYSKQVQGKETAV